MTVRLLALTSTAGLLLVGALGVPASAHVHEAHPHGSVSVTGAVMKPTTYAPAQLAALSPTTLPDRRSRRHPDRQLTGTLLEPLVTAAAPVLPAVKNAQLRVTLTVTGEHHRVVAVALAELDARNGDHPALLVADRFTDGVDLAFPDDRGYSRSVRDVRTIDVAVAAPDLPSDVPAGGLRVVGGRRTVTLSAATLAALPTRTRDVAFQSGQGPQQHVETGPTLARVLRAAHIRTGATTTVAAIAGDGYVATVTPAEATTGRRPLLLSTVEDGVPLDQPRLVTDGDVSGGRYVSGVLALEVDSSRSCR